MKKYDLEIIAGEIGQDGYVLNTGWVKTYHASEATREYIGATMEYVTTGGGLPAGAYLDVPEQPGKQDIAIIRSADGKSWLHVADYRGKTAYSTETRQPTEVDFIGDLPQTLTLLEPQTEFDVWDGKKWVTDKTEQQAHEVAVAESQKQSLLAEAEQAIAMLERKVRLGMATDEDKVKLNEWEIFSVKVADTDTSTAPDIDWPQKPQ